MKLRTAVSALAALTLSGFAVGQPIVKTGPCPTLTRYTPPENWTTFPIEPAPTSLYPVGTVQNPLTPQQSINCAQVPEGLKPQIVASELTPGPLPALAYLMHYTFDERGRVWAVDTRDYPYRHDHTTGAPINTSAGQSADRLQGESRVVILEDTNGDGALDQYKVFFDGIALPTSIEVVQNGVIVTSPPNIYYLAKSGTNPDTAGGALAIVTGMGSTGTGYDTHGQPNSLTRGLDNFMYGHTGYNGCGSPVVGTNPGVNCGGGNIWRFKATFIGSDTNVFQVYGTGGPSNSHGIGQMEDGQFFKSGATVSSHSNHQVRQGINAVGILPGGSNNSYWPATQDRYLWEGSTSATTSGFNSTRTSAVSGHDFYTARLLPAKYWNRFAFTCEGASKLCNQDSLVEDGATWSAIRMPGPVRSNIFVSTDAWTAPLKVRTGPDGALWVNDFYNYLFLHNPAGPSTNAAWRNALRAKTRTRLYRIIPEDGSTDPVLNLTSATTSELISTLGNSNFFWRLQAQRLLIERGYSPAVGDMLDSILTNHKTLDSLGLDVSVLHALWTLEGLGRYKTDAARWNPKLKNLLHHPAWTVRRNVLLAMPATAASAQAIKDECAVNDAHAHVRVQAFAALARMPVATTGPAESMDGLRSDSHLTSAYSAAGASKVTSVTGSARPGTCPAYDVPVAIAAGDTRKGFQARHDLVRFDIRDGGFELLSNGQLGSGELVVYDLRGQVAFRSTYNAGTARWSLATAKNLTHPVYIYSFRGVNGDSFNGRIALSQI